MSIHCHKPPLAHRWLTSRPRSLLAHVCCFALLLTGLCVSAAEVQHTTAPDSTESPGSGALQFDGDDGTIDAPLQSSAVRMTINGIVAQVELEQSFHNPSAGWVEGIYVFPLPEQAAIRSMNVTVGERLIEGRIEERRRAEAQHNAAAAAGRVSGLVRQERPNLFTTRIANIAPGENVRITLQYLQLIDYHDDIFSLRLPTTLTPRYNPSTVTDAEHITPPQSTSAEGTDSRLTLEARLSGAARIAWFASPSHTLSESTDPATDSLLINATARMDRDLVLTWAPIQGAEPVLDAWVETRESIDYLLAMVIPPAATAPVEPPDRELILVVDTSGSMGGESIRAAREALAVALDGLRSNDYFNIIAFDSTTRPLFDQALPADASALARARRYVTSLVADGGTEMLPALRLALGNPDSARLRQVVFITDGSVGNEEELFSAIDQQLRGSRLFTVGIGSAPNAYFMTRAATRGRGTYTWIATEQESFSAMTTLFAKLEQPRMTQIDIHWLGDSPDFNPTSVPDLYAGEPLIITARLGAHTRALTVSGVLTGQSWSTTLAIDALPRDGEGLSSLWARTEIDQLLERQRRATEPESYRPLITQLALDHQLLSPYTSFIATEAEPARPPSSPLQQAEISNLLPAGSEQIVIDLPRGAAGSDSALLIGALTLLLALGYYFTFTGGRIREPASIDL